MISGINSGLSALQAIQTKTQSTANNVANVNTDGYKKERVTLSDGQGGQGVTTNISKVETPGPEVYEQTQEGTTLVEKSNVELTEEMPNMLLNKRFFEANVKMIQAQDETLGSLLDIKS